MAKKHSAWKWIAGLTGIAAAAGAAYWKLGNQAYEDTFSPAVAARGYTLEKLLANNDEATLTNKNPHFPQYKADTEFIYAKPQEKISTISPRGERLHAVLIPNENHSNVWVIQLHAHKDTAGKNGPVLRKFYEFGYNLLCPHLNGHGESETTYVSMGWRDRLDVLTWIDYLIREYENPQIILHGISMGGTTVMMTTGEPLPKNVICAIEDCGFTSLWDEFSAVMYDRYDSGVPLMLNALETVTRVRSGFSLKEASSLEQLKKSQTPTLFIHGENDDFVPFWMLYCLYDAAACEKEYLTVPHASHAENHIVNPELYWGAIQQFILKHLHATQEDA